MQIGLYGNSKLSIGVIMSVNSSPFLLVLQLIGNQSYLSYWLKSAGTGSSFFSHREWMDNVIVTRTIHTAVYLQKCKITVMKYVLLSETISIAILALWFTYLKKKSKHKSNKGN